MVSPKDSAGQSVDKSTGQEEREPGRALKVLLAEDNDLNRLVFEGFLRKAGFEFVSVGNGAEALAAWREQKFDALLLDISMPVMDGLEVTRRIRAGLEPGLDKDLPIIALTAHALVEDRERLLRAGVNAYLTKPVKAETLVATILRVTGARS